MKSRILIGAITIALMVIGCQKENLRSDYLPRQVVIQDDAKDSITGVWRCIKEWTDPNFTVFYNYDDKFLPSATYTTNIYGDTIDDAFYTFNDQGQMICDSGSANVWHYTYWGETGKLKHMTSLNDSGTYYWNSTLDTAWRFIQGSFKYYHVDSNNNVIRQWAYTLTNSWTEYINPNPEVYYSSVSLFQGTHRNPYLLNEQWSDDGELTRWGTIDSVVDGRVYKYTWYNYGTPFTTTYEWQYLTHNAR